MKVLKKKLEKQTLTMNVKLSRDIGTAFRTTVWKTNINTNQREEHPFNVPDNSVYEKYSCNPYTQSKRRDKSITLLLTMENYSCNY